MLTFKSGLNYLKRDSAKKNVHWLNKAHKVLYIHLLYIQYIYTGIYIPGSANIFSRFLFVLPWFKHCFGSAPNMALVGVMAAGGTWGAREGAREVEIYICSALATQVGKWNQCDVAPSSSHTHTGPISGTTQSQRSSTAHGVDCDAGGRGEVLSGGGADFGGLRLRLCFHR